MHNLKEQLFFFKKLETISITAHIFQERKQWSILAFSYFKSRYTTERRKKFSELF